MRRQSAGVLGLSGEEIMTTRLTILFLILSLVGPNVARSELREIHLPELRGTYVVINLFSLEATVKVAKFQIVPAPIAVHKATLRIKGLSVLGEIACLPEIGGPFPWSYPFYSHLRDSKSYPGFTSFGEAPEGTFELMIDYRAQFGATVDWIDVLGDGKSKVYLGGGGVGFIAMCGATISPIVVVTEVVLLVDAEFPGPIKESTWGRIKALY